MSTGAGLPPPKDAGAAWSAVAQALRHSRPISEPDANLLAAWLEGRLEESEVAPVESWIAANPLEASTRLAELRESLAEAPPNVPQKLLLRLRALRPQRKQTQQPMQSFWRRMPQVAAVAATLALGLFGAYGSYEMGLRGSLPALEQERQFAQASLPEFLPPEDEFFFD
ncbi:hypothetical protein [Aquibaculum sediminis]|uniref:hypothetical protein n=1 Tax=Aquibaculum sediminis TaxID=3231907 RepID=UPI003452A400